ncbi:MAG TPA: sulfatase-like hydrolase/transferase [Terriglobia bacterium]|nr:sulfatase-like hydrolase/transferase [Terriglobia bacterium]
MSKTPPNFVLITIDTLRADHVGCYGDHEARTPNLDALARGSVLFRTVVASVPLTLPSHCSILTGTYPTRHGVRDNLGYRLGNATPTLASVLKEHGYSTAAFIGADVLDPRRGLDRGFDTYSCPLRRKIGRDNPLVFNLQELRRPADSVVADALDWIATEAAHSRKPFFVWIHLYDPHTPYDPPERFRSLVTSPYDGEVAYADYAVGKVFYDLKQRGLYDSTLVVATSDHGESFGEHGEYSHGYFVYDTTLLVPLIIKPPSGFAVAPHKVDTAVRTIDIAPTVLQFLHVPVSPDMEGSGRLPMMLDSGTNKSPDETAYSETYYPNEFGWSVLRSLRSGRFKYIDAPKPELYDLVADSAELHNLYPGRRAVALALKSRLESLMATDAPARAIQRAPSSAEEVGLLASLGYVGTSTSTSETGRDRRLPDPKDELPTFKVLSSATQLAAENKCDDAIPLLTRLIQQQPELALGHLTLAKCALSTGQYAAAAQSLDAALRLQPDNLEARFYKGICSFQQGQLDEALSSLEAVEKALPREPYVHFYLGLIYERQQRAESALAEFQECASVDPDFEVAVYKVGYFLAKAGRFSDAAAEFKRVIALDPDNPSAHYNLALAYAKSGDEYAARPEFETACRLSSAMCMREGQQ